MIKYFFASLYLLAVAFQFTACSNQENAYNKSSKERLAEKKKKNHKEIISTTQASSPGCDSTKWNYVYDPSRLAILDKCKTVTGTITERNADPDGDEHMLLKLDTGQGNLLKKKNITKKDGCLVIEAVCINKITRKRAIGACNGYVNDVYLPKVGEHVRVTGSYVLDTHNNWTEIHPITKVEKMK